MSSPLLAEHVSSLIEMLREPLDLGNVHIECHAVKARFLGGDIICGDLVTVSDIVEHVRERLASQAAPDVLVVPSTMFDYGLDLRGHSFYEIERRTGIPTLLAAHPRIME